MRGSEQLKAKSSWARAQEYLAFRVAGLAGRHGLGHLRKGKGDARRQAQRPAASGFQHFLDGDCAARHMLPPQLRLPGMPRWATSFLSPLLVQKSRSASATETMGITNGGGKILAVLNTGFNEEVRI